MTDYPFSLIMPQNEQELKKIVCEAVKFGRETVCPNFKYCAMDSEFTGWLYLSDSFYNVLEKAKKESSNGSLWYVCEIMCCDDKTYRLFIKYSYLDGERDFHDARPFVHFDYVALNSVIVKL